MIILYREGTSHVCNGITCEMQIVNEYNFEHMLENGWYLNPEECYPEPPKPSPVKKKEVKKETKRNEKLPKSLADYGPD